MARRKTPSTATGSASSQVSHLLERVTLVAFKTHLVAPTRDTGEGEKSATRIYKVLQRSFDPAVLRPFAALKQNAQRACRSAGTKIETLDAWAGPRDRDEALLAILQPIAEKWSQSAEFLAQEIGTVVERYAEEHPMERDAIRALAPSPHKVREDTRFHYAAFRLKGEDVTHAGGLAADLEGLAGQTLKEIAADLVDAGLAKPGRSHFTAGIVGVLSRISDKASSLAFVDPVIAQVASVLTGLLRGLPTKGRIIGNDAILVATVIDQLLNPRKVLNVGFLGMDPEQSTDGDALSESGGTAGVLWTPSSDLAIDVAW